MKKFLGQEISEYGVKNGYVDYATLKKSFDCILNNGIVEKNANYDLISGNPWYDEECEDCKEIFQWYIISENGADILKEYTEELVFYNYDLDLYLWGVTHFGTSWDCVLTDIKID